LGNGQQNPDITFGQLYEEGKASIPLHERKGGEIAADMRKQFPELLGDAKFEVGPLKELDRAQEKLGEFRGNHQNIVDIVRGRIVVDTPDQIRAVREYLQAHAKEMGIEVIKDRFAVPSETHYRDINIKVRLPNGHVAEIQINQRDLLASSEFTHDSYEDVQSLDREADAQGRDLTESEREKRAKLLDYTRDTHDAGAKKVPGIDDLLSEKGRARVNHNHAERLSHDPLHVPGVTIESDTKYSTPDISKAKAYGGPGYKKPGMASKVTDTLDDLGKGKKGFIIDGVIGLGVGIATYAKDGNAAEAAKAGLQTVNPAQQTTEAIMNGGSAADIAEGAADDGVALAGCAAGATAGGMAMGAAGSVVPLAGNVVGVAFGGIGGCVVGSFVATGMWDKLKSLFRGDPDQVDMKEVRNILPDQKMADMPPEVESMMVYKANLDMIDMALETLNENGIKTEHDQLAHDILTKQRTVYENLFEKQFRELAKGGGLEKHVEGYVAKYQQQKLLDHIQKAQLEASVPQAQQQEPTPKAEQAQPQDNVVAMSVGAAAP